ncbi:nuclear pore complex protein Nup133, partial [Silurus meridionalis]
MFTPRGTPGTPGRRHTTRTGGRKNINTPSGLLFSPRRASLTPGRATPTRVQSCTTVDSDHFDVQTFGSSLPVKVMEALTMAEADDQISVKVEETGWAWMVCGERLIIWKISQTAVAKLSVCKDLQLSPSVYAYSADLISISSSSALESASVQSVCVLAVSPEGSARFWPSLAHEGTYTETHTDLGGHLCNYVTAVRGGSFIVSSYRGQLLRVGMEASGKLYQRAVQQGQGMLSGIGRRVSSLFGLRSPPADTSVYSVLWARDSGCLYTLSTCGLNKWEVGDTTEVQVLSWNACPSLSDSIADAIWGSESNYAEMKAGVNVAYLDMQLSHTGLVVLAAAWHPADNPCLAYFCLVTLPDTMLPASEELYVEVTKYNPPFQSEEELHKTRLVLPRVKSPAAYLYNEELVYTCTTGAGRSGLPEEKLTFNASGDRIRGGGVCADLPVVFSHMNGLVAVVPRESASILPETMEDSLCTSLAGPGPEGALETPLKMDTVAQEDKTKLLKQAFLEFCRNRVMEAQKITDELFPDDGEGGVRGELDTLVTQIDLDLVDDYPASDPRWAESVPDENAGFPLTSLILLHQLEDKMKAHHFFMDFLLQTGLLDRLTWTTVRSSPMATRLLLCEHAEKLSAAVALKNHHSKQPELVNAAIAVTLSKTAKSVPSSLTPADVFFREVSRISSIFESLLDEEEKCLKENPVTSVKWAEVVLSVNIIIKEMLQAATQYRETKASLYRAAENAPPEPEYIPWTASGGVGGVRTVITRQHDVILRSVYPHADSGLRSTLSEQLVALLDSLLGGYVAQLTSLRRPRQQERYDALEMEYTQRRSELLTPLLELGQYQWVAALAEKYCDFDILVQMCEQTDNQTRLQHYMTKFADQNFADFLFRWYMEKGKRGKLLSQPIAQHQQLASFLQAHEHLSWLHHIHVQDFQKDLCGGVGQNLSCSVCKPGEKLQETFDLCNCKQRLLYQILTLTFSGVQILICSCIIQINSLKIIYLLMCIGMYWSVLVCIGIYWYVLVFIAQYCCVYSSWGALYSSWEASDGSDDPLEAASDSIFVKILQKLIQEGVPLHEYLPDVKELLQVDELNCLKSKPFFEFLLRANYEHFIQSQ